MVAFAGYLSRSPSSASSGLMRGWPMGWDDMADRNAVVAEIRRTFGGPLSEPEDRLPAVRDCSTLSGNSGSPVLDLEIYQVVGLHFDGRYLSQQQYTPVAADPRSTTER